jgi:hypothetical protein
VKFGLLGLVKIEITKLFLFQDERKRAKEISLKNLSKIIHARG